MEEKNNRSEQGQSIIVIAVAMIALLIFVVIAVDVGYGYVHRRGDQNAADAAALAGARELANIMNENGGSIPEGYFDDQIKIAMNAFAERNGIEDTGGAPGDVVNANVIGYYLDEMGNRITDADGNPILVNELGYIDVDARGIEAIASSMAPSFFGGIVGLDGLPINAESAVVFNGDVCSLNCIAPIATYTMTFQTDDNDDGFPCYNIWDGTRQQNAGGSCPDWGNCTAGTCQLNPAHSCSTKSDCAGVCPGGGVCSLPTDGSVSCENNGDCTADYGNCTAGTCQYNSSVACDGKEDCQSVCVSQGWTCSIAGTPCSTDDECPAEGDFCEDGVSSGSSSGLGWLNWSMQGPGHSCRDVGEADDCSTRCLTYNLEPGTCLSGEIFVSGPDGESWVAGTAGIKNSTNVRDWLEWYIDNKEPITVVIYDQSRGRGCNHAGSPGSGHLEYRVVGFAEFTVRGYELANGNGVSYGHDGAGCEDWGAEGNRITGTFIRWVDGSPGECDTAGTIVAPRVIK